MATRILIDTIPQLLDLLEDKKGEAREKADNQRIKVESHRLRGVAEGLDAAIYFIRQYQKTQDENADDSSNGQEQTTRERVTAKGKVTPAE